ncbi:MAG: hypothetical protein J6P10_03000 [Aeriscardovia sp.]|nr:hypothetical protein [Aeriscardovia sp.]
MASAPQAFSRPFINQRPVEEEGEEMGREERVAALAREEGMELSEGRLV